MKRAVFENDIQKLHQSDDQLSVENLLAHTKAGFYLFTLFHLGPHMVFIF